MLYGCMVSLCVHDTPPYLCDADSLFTFSFEGMRFKLISENHTSAQNNINAQKQPYTNLIYILQIGEDNMNPLLRRKLISSTKVYEVKDAPANCTVAFMETK